MSSDTAAQPDPIEPESGHEPDSLDPDQGHESDRREPESDNEADPLESEPGHEPESENEPEPLWDEELHWYEYESVPIPEDEVPAEEPPAAVGRRIVRGVGWTLIWFGLLTLGFVAHQLWVTTYFAQRNQAGLAEQRIELNRLAEVQEVEYVAPDGRTGTIITEEPVPEGYPGMRIRVPSLERLEEGWEVVEGVSVADLRNGAGHMPDTPLPGQPGNSVISGHRTTYGSPFHEFDQLELGDLIEVDTATGTHVYAVRESFIVQPTDVWVTEPREGAWLTLTTCHPKFSAAQRLIVVAELVGGPNAEVIGAMTP